MPQYLILAQSKQTALALGAWLELLGQPPIKDPESTPQVIIHSGQMVGGQERAVLAYEHLVRCIERAATDSSETIPINEIIILVDAVKPSALNPLAEGGWDNLIAMLILTFPEIRWIFGVSPVYSDTTKNNNKQKEPEACDLNDAWKRIKNYHSLESLLSTPRRDPLMDATGLRNFVRDRANDTLKASQREKMEARGHQYDEALARNSLLPIRDKAAAAIDEELYYALFHAYAAYRFGYRADAVRSWTLMEHLFNESSGKTAHDFHLLLEDVNLNFPDKPGRTHLSTFNERNGKKGRAHHCNRLADNPSLETSRFRIIVTSGHSGADQGKMESNCAYVMGYKRGIDGYGYVPKPVGGMFDLWTLARLFARLDPRQGVKHAGAHRGQAPGFYWPPKAGEEAEDAGGHSAPGKLMLIAQHLVRRADCTKDSANTVEESIRGAVLATDALELLRYQTPTLALQALCLKHEFEVRAEVAFLGVGNHFALKPRLAELEREVKAAAHFFEKKRRAKAELDTLASIGNRLMLIFREAGQFDEEMECLARIRKWYRKLRIKQVDNPFKKPAQFVMYYAEWLLESPGRFIWAIICWFIVFWFMWSIVPTVPIEEIKKAVDEVANASFAWNTFISNNPGEAKTIPGFLLNAAATTVGIFHLGVFISYLYSSVTRK